MTTAPVTDVSAVPALRAGLAAAVCTLLAHLFRLEHGYLATMSAYMALVKFEFTAFQRGLERFLGRALGICWGLILLSLFRNMLLPLILVCGLSMMVSFYINQAGRLAYGWLNFGLYFGLILIIGLDDPTEAYAQAWDMLLSIFLGVMTANVVNWLTGGEQSLHIEVGQTPMWPLRMEWVRQAARLVVMFVVIVAVCRWAELPDTATGISFIIVGLCSDRRLMFQKGVQRIEGALLGTLWSTASFILVLRLPHLSLLLAMIFLGTFIAARLAQTSATLSYVGMQMGLVLCMVLAVPASSFGTFDVVGDRLVAILIATSVAIIVGRPPKSDNPATPKTDARPA